MPVYRMDEYSPADFSTLPVDAVIGVEVEEITPKVVTGKNGKQDWTKLEFKFLVDSVPSSLEAEYADVIGTRIWGAVSENFTAHPDNKLRQWAEALLDLGDLPPGFELDTDMLIGRHARAVVGNYDKRDGTKAHQVIGLLPAGSTLAGVTAGSASAPAVEAVGPSLFDDDPPPF